MRNVSESSITQAVVHSFDSATDPRFKQIIESLTRHLHAFAREVDLTPQEWKAGIDFLYRAGQLSDEKRNEFILTSDVLGLSSLVDMLQSDPGATERSALGPFHSGGSPALAVGGDLKQKNDGEPLLVHGRVLDEDGKPVAGAQLDFWQAAVNGQYWQQDPAQDPHNLRFRMTTGEDGVYAFTTVQPAPYSVPYDGPVGDLLRAGGRHAWRPAHFHFIVSAAGFRPLTTEVFFSGDPYLDSDAIFGVRESLVVTVTPNTDAALAKRYRLVAPFLNVAFDFRLGH